MKVVLTANKQRGLYSKFLERLKEAEEKTASASKKGYVPFPVIFEKVCRGFSIDKQTAWECIFLLREFGFVEIVKFHGIKLNYQIKK